MLKKQRFKIVSSTKEKKDIEVLFERCRFSDCTHTKEPGCAVIKALDDGTISPARWKNYKRIKEEAKFTEDKAGYLKGKNEFFKKVSKDFRARQKSGGKRA
jgi:ribosome biogenesis GTPase